MMILIRDPNDPSAIIANQNAVGTTDDDGVTVTIPLGYLSDISNVAMTDFTGNLLPPPIPFQPTGVVSRTDDYENNTSTIVFSYD
jgi:hypothetical protein